MIMRKEVEIPSQEEPSFLEHTDLGTCSLYASDHVFRWLSIFTCVLADLDIGPRPLWTTLPISPCVLFGLLPVGPFLILHFLCS